MPTEVLVALIIALQTIVVALLGVAAKLGVSYLRVISDSVHPQAESAPPRKNGEKALIDYTIEAATGIAHLQEQHDALARKVSEIETLMLEDSAWRRQYLGGPLDTGEKARAFVEEVERRLGVLEDGREGWRRRERK